MSTSFAATKGERYEFRLSRSDRALFERAAQLQGLKFSEFVLRALREQAENTLRENDIVVLTARDSRTFVEALINPPELNARLRRALARHREPVD
jgi:uncharacterized protein (DUF1778 family)